MPFRNPYHFVPISDAIPHTIESPVGKALTADRLGHRTFDRYHQNTLSGRLVCCLTTVGPVVIGAQQTKSAEEGYTSIQPFERNGSPAIPASTLRGCISAVAETAGNSALRVLDNTEYSRRVTMEEVGQNVGDFSAMGMIKEIPHSAHEFFRQVNPELLPYHQGRTKITPAEAMFGFVEVNKKGETKDAARALASRIRFSEGRITSGPDGDYYHPETLLRILASPKPPCPPFYFRKNQLPSNLAQNVPARDCYISKRELELNPQHHRPQGRKFYLNHVIDPGLANRSYKTRHPEENQQQKNKVKPLREGCRFVFHIDFNNLSRWELGLLIYAIQPTAEFHHKIGLAKALGLGTVKLEIAGLFYVDRQKRYSGEGFYNAQGELERRYHRCWIHRDLAKDQGETFEKDELEAIAKGTLSNEVHDAPDQLKAEFAKNLFEPIRKALHKIGRPGVANIKPPLETGQQDSEEETFKWFQKNDNVEPGNRQGLIPLEYGDDVAITGLHEN